MHGNSDYKRFIIQGSNLLKVTQFLHDIQSYYVKIVGV